MHGVLKQIASEVETSRIRLDYMEKRSGFASLDSDRFLERRMKKNLELAS